MFLILHIVSSWNAGLVFTNDGVSIVSVEIFLDINLLLIDLLIDFLKCKSTAVGSIVFIYDCFKSKLALEGRQPKLCF